MRRPKEGDITGSTRGKMVILPVYLILLHKKMGVMMGRAKKFSWMA
jgi:hypothetical protein